MVIPQDYNANGQPQRRNGFIGGIFEKLEGMTDSTLPNIKHVLFMPKEKPAKGRDRDNLIKNDAMSSGTYVSLMNSGAPVDPLTVIEYDSMQHLQEQIKEITGQEDQLTYFSLNLRGLAKNDKSTAAQMVGMLNNTKNIAGVAVYCKLSDVQQYRLQKGFANKPFTVDSV